MGAGIGSTKPKDTKLEIIWWINKESFKRGYELENRSREVINEVCWQLEKHGAIKREEVRLGVA